MCMVCSCVQVLSLFFSWDKSILGAGRILDAVVSRRHDVDGNRISGIAARFDGGKRPTPRGADADLRSSVSTRKPMFNGAR
jgi:hypothetical protein